MINKYWTKSRIKKYLLAQLILLCAIITLPFGQFGAILAIPYGAIMLGIHSGEL